MQPDDVPIHVTATPIPDYIEEDSLANIFIHEVIEASQSAMIHFGYCHTHVNLVGTNVQGTTMRAHYIMPLDDLLEATGGDRSILQVAIPKVSREFQARYIAVVSAAYFIKRFALDPAAAAYQNEHGSLSGFPGAVEILSIHLEGREGYQFFLFPVMRNAAGRVTGFGPNEGDMGQVNLVNSCVGLLHPEGEVPNPGDPSITIIDTSTNHNPEPGDLPN
jgi:hypothetical protein